MFHQCEACNHTIDVPVIYADGRGISALMCKACGDIAWDITDAFTWCSTEDRMDLLQFVRRERERRRKRRLSGAGAWALAFSNLASFLVTRGSHTLQGAQFCAAAMVEVLGVFIGINSGRTGSNRLEQDSVSTPDHARAA